MLSRITFAMMATPLLVSCGELHDSGPRLGWPVPTGDVVAVGTLENLDSESRPLDSDDLIGQGVFTAKFHVKRVESGTLTKEIVPVRYFGHTWLREDVRFRFHLRPKEGGTFIICKAPDSAGYICD